MRFVAMLALLLVLGGGIAVAYTVYRQLDTKTVLIDAAGQWEQRDDGSSCETVAFAVGARTTGLWYVASGGAAKMWGSLEVEGTVDKDVGLEVYTPSNRVAYRAEQRMHQGLFELAADVRGDYRFQVDNRHSAFTKKRVTLFVCVA
jgi:hypothetical protein